MPTNGRNDYSRVTEDNQSNRKRSDFISTQSVDVEEGDHIERLIEPLRTPSTILSRGLPALVVSAFGSVVPKQ